MGYGLRLINWKYPQWGAICLDWQETNCWDARKWNFLGSYLWMVLLNSLQGNQWGTHATHWESTAGQECSWSLTKKLQEASWNTLELTGIPSAELPLIFFRGELHFGVHAFQPHVAEQKQQQERMLLSQCSYWHLLLVIISAVGGGDNSNSPGRAVIWSWVNGELHRGHPGFSDSVVNNLSAQCRRWENPMDRRPGELQSMEVASKT